jgi:signal transduction histidine kinase
MPPAPDPEGHWKNLSTLTEECSGAEWAEALAEPLHRAEYDRRRAGRILHDEVGQLLSALGLQLDLLRLDFSVGHPDLAERTADIQAVLDRTMTQLRDVIGTLIPSPVDRAGLRFALGRLIEEHRANFHCGVTLDFPSKFRVTGSAAAALLVAAEWAIDQALKTAATSVGIKVYDLVHAYALEVLYDAPSPGVIASRAEIRRLDLLRLRYHALRTGLAVSLASGPEQGTRMRAVYGVATAERVTKQHR